MKTTLLLVALFFAATLCSATTFVVGPSTQYPTPCSAIYTGSSSYQGQPVAQSGDTVEIQYNNGIPYQEPPDWNHGGRADCKIFNSNILIVGVGGRPVMDGTGATYEKGIFDLYGSHITISNVELRNVRCDSNCAGVRVNAGSVGTPNGGDIEVNHSFIHDNEDGILTANTGPGIGLAYNNPNAEIRLLYDEFYNNGNNNSNDSQFGATHNMYIGYDGYGTAVFQLAYSWSHDSFIGHTVKSRSPNSNLYYNLIGDAAGNSSYLLDFPLGGTTYVVGNSIYKAYDGNLNANRYYMVYADVADNTPTDPEYGPSLQDLHFVNNTVLLDPADVQPSYVDIGCADANFANCATPNNGPAVSVAAAIENNLFVGPAGTPITNQSIAYVAHNVVVTNNSSGGGGMMNLTNGSNVAANFVDAANYNFSLVSGSPAIGAGMPPTLNDGTTLDSNAVAAYEYVMVGDTMSRSDVADAGAYSVSDSLPSYALLVNYSPSQVVNGPGTITLTVTGFPTPQTYWPVTADFISSNLAVLGSASSITSTSSVSAVLTVYNPTVATVVPVDIFVNGSYVQAMVTVRPGSGAPTVGLGPNVPGAPSYIQILSGGGQSALLGTPFAQPVVVGVYDQAGRPIPGVTVSVSGNGVTPASGVSSASGTNTGHAAILLTPTVAGSSVGPLNLTARVSGGSNPTDTFTENGLATFTLALAAGPVATLYGGTQTLNATITNYGLAGTVNFTCVQVTAYTNITCTPPAAVTLTALDMTVPVTFTIASTGTAAAKSNAPASPFNGTLPISFAVLFGMLFIKRKSAAKYLVLAVAVLAIFGMSACSNDKKANPVPASENAKFTLTATSGTSTSTVLVDFTVNP